MALNRRSIAAISVTAVVVGVVAFLPRARRYEGGSVSDVHPIVAQNVGQIDVVLSTFNNVQRNGADPPWVLFHGLLGHMSDYTISDANGSSRSCLEWLLVDVCSRPAYRGCPLAVRREWGVTFAHGLGTRMEFEDHFCQFLFILTECGLNPKETAICLPPSQERYMIAQLVADEQRFCHGVSDLSWALPVFIKWGARKWTNRFGEVLDIDVLLRQHLTREATCNACFGTHWKLGLAITIRDARSHLSNETMAAAQRRLRAAISEAKASMSIDGAFYNTALKDIVAAPQVTTSKAGQQDYSPKVSYQAHMLEWLMVALSDHELLTQEWPHRAAQCLIEYARRHPTALDYGAFCHAAHALRQYRARIKLLPGMPAM